MGSQDFVICTAREGLLTIAASGAWTADNAARLESCIDQMRPDEAPRLQVDMGDVKEFDTFGAWILERLMRGDGRARQASLVRLPEHFRGLVEDVGRTNRRVPTPPNRRCSRAM